MKYQKGFINPAVIIIAAVLIVAGGSIIFLLSKLEKKSSTIRQNAVEKVSLQKISGIFEGIKIEFETDGQDWRKLEEKSNRSIFSFTPDAKKDSEEGIAIQYFPVIFPLSLGLHKSNFEEVCQSGTWTTIREDPSLQYGDSLYEFDTHNCPGLTWRYELGKIMWRGEAFFMLKYQRRDSLPNDSKKEQWIKLFDGAKIAAASTEEKTVEKARKSEERIKSGQDLPKGKDMEERAMDITVTSRLFRGKELLPQPFGMVNVRNGNYFLQQIDFDSEAPLRRFYNSRSNAPSGPLGHGWNFTYGFQIFKKENMVIKGFNTSGLPVILESDGSMTEFYPEPPAQDKSNVFAAYVSPAGQRLENLKDGTLLRTIPNGISQTFDKDGVLIKMVSSDGEVLKLSYSGSRLIAVTSANGQNISFSYAPDGTIKSAESAGKKITYEHDSRRDLTKVIYSDGTFVKFTYDNKHNLVQAIFQGGKKLNLTYHTEHDWVARMESLGSIPKTYEYFPSTENTNESRTVVTYTPGIVPVVYNFIDDGKTMIIDDGSGWKITVHGRD